MENLSLQTAWHEVNTCWIWPGPAAGDAALCYPVGCRVFVGLHPLGTTPISSGGGWRLPRPSLHIEKMGKFHWCGPSAHCKVQSGIDPATQKGPGESATAPLSGAGLEALLGVSTAH